MRHGPLATTGALLIAAGLMAAPKEATPQRTAGKGAAPAVRTDPTSGLELVRLAAGTFHFGCEPGDGDCSGDERPGRRVDVGSMWIGKTEATVHAYARCVADGACTEPNVGGACNWAARDRDDHPVNCVDWDQATRFCQHMGGRLPTAEEWEYAAKGGESRIYPWGNDAPTDRRANFADAQYKKKYPRSFDIPGQDDGWIESAPVGTFPEGATKQGLLDMAGNVIEWTSSEYEPGQMEARGGGWATDTVSRRLRASYRTGRARSYWHATFGFRCAIPVTGS
jgi:formylglycine-generating enzyme required for sulfatase activity